ncbi:MAG: AraC family transcriptional regulator [Myxococcota bacterium]
MRSLVHAPSKPLGDWVAAVWYFEGPEISHAMERLVPNGAMQLLVNLDSDALRWWPEMGAAGVQQLSGAALAGAFGRPFGIDTAQQRRMTGVSFRPGGASAFFSGSMQAFANEHVSLSMISGCGSIRDELLEAAHRGARAVIGTWVRFLKARWHRQPDIHRARGLLEAGLSVQQAADQLSVSVRKFRQDFAAWVGLSPKVYSRVHRMQQLVRVVAEDRGGDGGRRDHRDRDWASLALRHGYFDQAHMIHEFRALTGVTPMNYFPRSVEDWNHAIDDADSYNTAHDTSATKRA